MTKRERAKAILDRLRQDYNPAGSFLAHHSAWELLVATILAAQCTDERVNMVTPGLFKRWPGPKELAKAGQEELEEVVRSTGFFRNKAKNLINCAKMVMTEFGGTLPRTMAEMIRLPGVARKTANIVLNTAMGVVEGIAIDTHAKRLAFRMDLTDSDNPDRIEQDLCAVFDRSVWGQVNHLLVQHGRAVCQARKPFCSRCRVAELCPRKGVDKAA